MPSLRFAQWIRVSLPVCGPACAGRATKAEPGTVRRTTTQPVRSLKAQQPRKAAHVS